ncbi:MAG TPA: DNA gyrase inhibitor YacG [Pseudobdellovibrionaceae bacterium]|nr:DNA gyrase inhibitor YacG [Pseudobdellovibrionaceae bacterium]
MVRCPQCGQPALFSSENPARPFCSERCKLIDLGQWADERYKVPAENQTPSTDDIEAWESENSD